MVLRLQMISRLVIVVLLTTIAVLGVSEPASAHAALGTSSPVAGSVVPTSPTEIVATFTEPLERNYSRLQLFDSQGVQIEGTTLVAGNDDYTMVLKVPSTLPNGTYSVLWRTLSNADGHTAQNYFAFTVGTNADIVSVVVPNSVNEGGSAPLWQQTLGRWSAYLGVAALLGVWIVWSQVIRPAVGGSWRQAPSLVRRARLFAKIAIGLAILGSVAALLVQAQSLQDGTYFDKVMNTLGQTRYGRLWLIRVGLIAVEGVLLFAVGWWYVRRRQIEGWLAILVAAAIPIPFGMIAHASAQPSGKAMAIATDAVHLFAASVWISGLLMLSTVLFPWTRTLDQQARRMVLATAIPRFTVLALISLAMVGVTGAYAGWLQVGNLEALTSTDYGQSLIVKLVLLVLILGIASVNLFVIERHLVEKVKAGLAEIWPKRLTWTVAGECLLVILMLGAVGRMTSLQPAREQVVERAQQIEIDFSGPGEAAQLLLAPGLVGPNHFRVEVDGPALPAETTAVLRFTIPDQGDLGTKEIPLSRVLGNAFEYHGNELSIAGNWAFTLIIRPPGTGQVSLEASHQIGAEARDVDVPGKPWRFETTGGLTGLGLLLVGIAGLVVAIRATSSRLRKESGGLGLAALILGLLLLVQARIDPALAETAGNAINPNDVALVEKGKSIYATYCLSCHGPELRGDGPDAAGLQPPPADFTQPHTMVHSESDLVYWLRYGKQGTAMPGFGGVLSDADMRAVLSYIEYEQQQFVNATPVAGGGGTSCTVEPRSIAEIQAIVDSGQAEPNPNAPLQAASDPTVDAATTAELQAVTGQLVACTNGLETMRRLGLFSDGNLAGAFSTGLPPGFAEASLQQPTPLPADQQVTLVGLENPQLLTDGRVSATVIVNDPGGQFSGAEGGTNLRATIVFVQVGDQWLIDEIRSE